MASFEDLAPFTLVPGERLVAVGWLDPERPFPTAPPDAALVRALRALSISRQPPGAPTGFHRCAFCEANPRSGSRVIVVFGEGVAYVAPELIGHYVQKHSYAPPREFVRAALAQVEARADDWQGFVRHFPALRAVNEYPAGQIVVLEALEAVRKRPAMYIGSTDARGLGWMLNETVAFAVDRHLLGTATRIDVAIAPDGWGSVEDDGEGLAVNSMAGEQPAVEAMLVRLLAGSKFGSNAPRVSMGGYGQGVAIVNGLSQRFEVETRQDGQAWRLSFECGRLAEPLARVGPTAKRGTRVRYLADDEILDTIHLDVGAVEKRLADLAQLLPDLELRFQDKPVLRHATLADWLADLVPGVEAPNVVCGRGSFGDATVDFAASWRPNATTPWVRSFANWQETLDGGVHAEALLEVMTRMAPEPARSDALSRGLVGVVHVALLDPRCSGAWRRRLENEEARPAVEHVVREALEKNPTFWDWLLENVSG